MTEKIKDLKNKYITMREQTRAMKLYVKDPEDIIKLNAGVVTFDMIIKDLEDILE